MTERRTRGIVEAVRGARARHIARHRATGFEFALADRISYVNAGDWDAVTARASVFASRAYLGALDAAPPDNVRPRYAVAYRDGAPVAALAMQVAQVRAQDAVPPPAARTGVRKVAGMIPWRRLVRPRILVCGNLLAWGRHGVTFAPGVAPADAWPAVAEALYRVRRAERLGGQTDLILVKDVGEPDLPGMGALETYSYRAFETEPDMVLDLPAGCATFGDYLGLLRGKYRKGAKEVLAAVDRAGYRTETLAADGLDALAGRLHALYAAVHAQAAVRLFVLPQTYLPRVGAALGDRFRCAALRRDGEVAGYVTVVRDGDTAVGYYMGFDRAVNESVPLYFRLLYACVETALAMGCRRVSFGRTALEPKARLGARPVPLRCWVRHRVPVVNVALRRWLREVPHDAPPERAPFKEG